MMSIEDVVRSLRMLDENRQPNKDTRNYGNTFHSAANEIERLQEENKRLKKPSWYFDDDCGESVSHRIHDLVDQKDTEDVVEIQPVHKLPMLYVVRDDSDVGYKVYETRPEADEAVGTKPIIAAAEVTKEKA